MKLIHIALILFLCFSGCSANIQGTLTDARDYLNTGTLGDEGDEFSAFHAMEANLPVIVVTKSKRVYYLVVNSRKLSPYATDWVKVRGKKKASASLLIPSQIWVKKGNTWVPLL